MRIGEIRLTSAHCQWSNIAATSMEVIDDSNIRDVDVIETPAVPGIKAIMRPHGKPSDGAKAEAGMVSKAHKEAKCRRPKRTIADIKRSRPPAPVVSVIKPPSVMVGSPSPRLV